MIKEIDGKVYATVPEPGAAGCLGCVADADPDLCHKLGRDDICVTEEVIWMLTSKPVEPKQFTKEPEVLPKSANLNEVLLIIQEECAEVVQAVSKVIRFGWENHHPERTKTNREELEEELGDLLAMYDILLQTREIDPANVSQARANKYNKLKQYSKVFNV
jgi:NTP pyrophosphatase (non-canonical NTP hydrolase)